MRDFIVVIPARFNSSRFPGKPLVDLYGMPMVVRTYLQCAKVAPQDKIFIATDDERIRSVCDGYGINVMMTSSECLTGTDRVADVSDKIFSKTYINVQGDEPLFNPNDLEKLIDNAIKNPNTVLNGFCTIHEEELYRSTSIPKVVMDPNGELLYMSRAGIPANKSNTFQIAHRQVCAYAFPRSALHEFRGYGRKGDLEKIEDIEILRFLELGWSVQMIKMSSDSISVDHPEDLIRVQLEIKRRGCM